MFTNKITIPNDLARQGQAIYKIMLWILFPFHVLDLCFGLAQIFQNSIYILFIYVW